MHSGPFGCLMKLGAKRGETSAKVRATKSRPIFFAMNALDPPHWTLNSCFGVFHNVWMHLGSFRNCMKLGTKQGEVVHAKVRAAKSRRDFFPTNAPNPPHCTLN